MLLNITENQLEKNMENETGTGIMWGLAGTRCFLQIRGTTLGIPITR